MLLPLKVAQGVADGSVTLAFRRWKKQDVRPGQQFMTAAGMVRVDDVTVVDAEAITDEEARLAGWPDAERLRKRLAPDERCRPTGCGCPTPAPTRGSRCASRRTSPRTTSRSWTAGSSGWTAPAATGRGRCTTSS